jgi:hypothetical protein
MAESNAVVSGGEQPSNHVRAHAPESDHSDLHGWLLNWLWK